MAVHTPGSSGQQRSPVCDPIAVPCPYEYEQESAESGRIAVPPYPRLLFAISIPGKGSSSQQ